MRLPRWIFSIVACCVLVALLCTSAHADVIGGLTRIWSVIDSPHAVAIQDETITVPEPASVAVWIITVGLGGFAGWRMRRKEDK